MGQLTVIQKLVVNFDLFRHAQAVRHLDDIHAVEERFVVLVVTEGHPLGFVGVRQNNAAERQGGDTFGAVVVAFLGCGQQRMQHLDRRFEHLDEFHNPLVGAAQGAGIAVGVRVVLRVVLQFTDVHFTDQRRDVLVVLIARLGFGDGDLFQNGRAHFHDFKLGNIATELMQALRRPRRHDGAEIATWDIELFFQDRGIFLRIEQAQRMIVDRAAFAVGAEGVDGHALHQRFQTFRQRGLAAAHRAQQVKDLFLLFQSLSGVFQVRDDLFDGLFHAVELFEGRIACDHAVGEQARQA
ncbi:Uncharacterised protein [Acinetobacter baumannii]|nr:Uncharacterised protein [Acinetobacter baumannii]